MIKTKNTRGLILAEALVAVATLGIAAMALSTIIQNALAVTELSKDYLIAQNLATEAIEAVKSVKHTNLLIRPRALFPDAQGCWLVLDPQTIADPQIDCILVADKDEQYLVIMEDGRWKMEASDNPDTYRLALKDEQYIHSMEAGADPTKFYREVEFIDVPEDNQYSTFEVKIKWKHGAKERNIVRQYTLFNSL